MPGYRNGILTMPRFREIHRNSVLLLLGKVNAKIILFEKTEMADKTADF